MESGNLRRALKAKSHLSVENANLRAEIERLRAALQRLRAIINRAGALTSQKASHGMILDALSEIKPND